MSKRIRELSVSALLVLVLVLGWISLSSGFAPHSRDLTRLQQQWPSLQGFNSKGGSSPSSSFSQDDKIPFIVDRISDNPNERIFQEVSEMCIEVFFNPDGVTPPWKSLQLGYLRSLQAADLRRRRTRIKARNEMFVARRVVSLNSPLALQNTPLILDLDFVRNLVPEPGQDYVRGEVLGFCEVTEREYGLIEPAEDQTGRSKSTDVRLKLRPLLTNLSVKKEARQSGIGGRLVEACEQAVVRWDTGHGEIILEVEDDNLSALRFYSRRGYQEIFADPACRRFNTNGLLLAKERCTKICMRKSLALQRALGADKQTVRSKTDLSTFFKSIRENVFR